jgi:hypothetical protein
VHSIFKFSVNTLGSSLCTESLYSDSGKFQFMCANDGMEPCQQ